MVQQQPKPGSEACGLYLKKTAQMIQELVAMCGEEPATVLREKYDKDKPSTRRPGPRMHGSR